MQTKKVRILVAALMLVSAPAFSTGLSPVEKNIINVVKADKESQIHFLETLTNIQSGTLNIKGVHAVGEVVKKDLEQLGFQTTWAKSPAVMNRGGTLMAIHPSKHGKRLLLIAHLDTVFSQQAPFKKFSQKKHSATGQGVLDDKGGIAVMLYALKALDKVGRLKDMNVTVMLMGDEEESGKPASISRRPLMMAANKADISLDFEPSISLGTATIARRGISNWTMTVNGNASHSATIFHPDVGVGAIFGVAKRLDDMRTQMKDIPNLSFNPGLIFGGSSVSYNAAASSGTALGKENVVASVVKVKGDVRYLDEKQKQSAEQKMRDIVSSKLPGIKSNIEFVDGIPPMSPTANNLKLLNAYSQVSQDLGQGKVVPIPANARGAGDISYIAGVVQANLSGIGPVGFGTHTVIESIDLSSLITQTERAAILMMRLTS
tara:strand:- start:11 stop:1309 length:1299 start_codon:yes stop_codon:yes gene_type:complete